MVKIKILLIGGEAMDKRKLVEKLREKTNISYEEAKNALENSSWDILDAIVYLEEQGKIKKPHTSEFYTNESKESYSKQGELIKVNHSNDNNNSQSKNDFNGFFEAICKAIDTGNNIFLEIKRQGRMFLKIPITVVILLLFFAFWIIIPLMILGLFFEVEFSVVTKRVDNFKINKINQILKDISKSAQDIKRKIAVHMNS